jgi:Ser-tRNA(Ala) deacylase AlaX
MGFKCDRTMVKKLFYDDGYLSECEAEVVSVDNGIRLDKTVFFGFSGGQMSDSGTINGIKVVEARCDGNDIVYVLEEMNFKVGDKVEVKIDSDKRDRIRKLHSAAHIVFVLFEEKTGIKSLIGSNVTDTKSRLDYSYDESISPMLPEIEEKVNEVISKGLEVKTFYEEGEKRLWTCGDWKCSCGGTHVKSTNEIGKIKLKRKNIGAGKERIEVTLE